MKRLKIMKAYAVLALFIYFLVYSNLEAMATFFFATLTFNLAVLTVLTIGIIVIMRSSINLVMLAGTFGILAYKKDNLTFYLQGIEKIMPANIAHMFHSRAEKGVLLFTSEESRSVIEWIDEKFSHQNRYINYFIGTSLMIGLLGTFTGLLVAIDQMGTIILSLSGDIDLGAVIASFSGPLSGMAIGFGSSLFGVISAIILGLMGYILNKNQEALIEGVEDWLKGRIIDTGGAGLGAPTVTTGAAEALPDHKNSFMDVFIDNISSLTKEMAKISVTNERLHSITIASVQQTRDEHEVNYELFEAMSNSLVSINSNAQEHAATIQERLSGIENVIVSGQKIAIDELKENISRLSTSIVETLNSNSDRVNEQSAQIAQILTTLDAKLKTQLEILSSMQATQTDANVKVDESRERLEELRENLKELATILNKNEQVETQNLQNILESLSGVTEKLQSEMTLLESLEKLHKIQINDVRKQTKLVESLDTNSTQTNALIQESQNTTENVTQKLQALEELLNTQTQNQEKDLASQEESQELLQKHRELLELIVGKNEENINELRRIASLQTSQSGETIATFEPKNDGGKPRGFFSKIFG
jgi:hypothetical protein